MKKQSKFKDLMDKTKEMLIQQNHVSEESKTSDDELVSLLLEPSSLDELTNLEVENSEPVVTEDFTPIAEVVVSVATKLEKTQPEQRRAYNIYYNNNDKSYYKDTLVYMQPDNLVSISTERLTSSQALAMMEAKKIFTMKLISKKQDYI